MFKEMWNNMWAFFRNSGTVLLARLEAAAGFLMAALSSIDWSLLTALDFSQAFVWNQLTALGSIIFIKGLVTEWVRISGTKDVGGHLIPTAESLEPNVTVKTKTKKTKN